MRKAIITFCAVASLGAFGVIPPAFADHHNEKVYMFNTLPISPNAYNEFLPLMQNNAQNSRKESGNITFDVFVSKDTGTTIYLFEEWKSEDALEQHMKTQHLKAVAAVAGSSFAEGQTENSLKLDKISPDVDVPTIEAPGKTSNVVVNIFAKPDQLEELTDALLLAGTKARQAEGSLRFDLYQSKENKNHLVLFERWTTKASHDAWLASKENQSLGDVITRTTPSHQSRLLLEDVAQ